VTYVSSITYGTVHVGIRGYVPGSVVDYALQYDPLIETEESHEQQAYPVTRRPQQSPPEELFGGQERTSREMRKQRSREGHPVTSSVTNEAKKYKSEQLAYI
jgi:hypothetical protein